MSCLLPYIPLRISSRPSSEIGTDTAPDAIYIRISSKEHIDDKKRRYKKYGILVEALVFGIFFGCCLVTLILIFACI